MSSPILSPQPRTKRKRDVLQASILDLSQVPFPLSPSRVNPDNSLPIRDGTPTSPDMVTSLASKTDEPCFSFHLYNTQNTQPRPIETEIRLPDLNMSLGSIQGGLETSKNVIPDTYEENITGILVETKPQSVILASSTPNENELEEKDQTTREEPKKSGQKKVSKRKTPRKPDAKTEIIPPSQEESESQVQPTIKRESPRIKNAATKLQSKTPSATRLVDRIKTKGYHSASPYSTRTKSRILNSPNLAVSSPIRADDIKGTSITLSRLLIR